MNSLFKVTRKEPAGAGVFKFSFKLGGDDEEVEEDAPTKKKNKNRKKKKKTSVVETTVGDDLIQDDPESGDIFLSSDGLDMDKIASLLDEVQIGSEIEMEGAGAEQALQACQNKPLSKSQKKNLQKKKAKKTSEQQLDQTECPTGNSNTSDNNVIILKTEQKKPAVSNSKDNTIKTAPDSDDEFAVPEPKAPKNKKPKAQAQPKPKPARSQPSGLAFAHLAAPEQRGPHFLSSKDPELDEATKLRFKYGMGRNLVAIGPAKVRDPNWLPPPPGLTRSNPLSGVFGNSSAGRTSSPAKQTPVKANNVAENIAEEVHSSPFSFSFNGL